MTYKLKFTAHAKHDLEKIFEYISYSLHSPTAAADIMREIDESITVLKTFPNSSPLCNDEYLLKKGFRKLAVKNYIVLYKSDNVNSTVIIHRVVNGRINYKNSLSN